METDKLQQFKLQQDQELKKLAAEFDDFVNQADKEFSQFLKNEWDSYQVFKGIAIPEKPKPTETPEAPKEVILAKMKSKEITVIPVSEQEPTLYERPILPVVQKTEPADFLKTTTSIDFYGTSLNIQFDDRLAMGSIDKLSEQAIGDWWTMCSQTYYNQLVNELFRLNEKLSLNDWAYFKLVEATANKIAASDKNKTRLLSWFLMIRSGYDVKMAYSGNQLFLLIPTVNQLYGKSYLTIHGVRYYFVEDVNADSFQTYDFSFPGANRMIDLNIYQPLNIGDDFLTKQIAFKNDEAEVSFPVLLSVNTLYLLKDYPLTDLSVFFNAPMSRVTKESLAEGLIPYLAPMETSQALNFLLRFVQNSFKYMTDQEQFNAEKFFFPEELFFYAGSDCEDRSALFAYLVRQLLHLDVIGLEYPGHVATAVNLNSTFPGEYLTYQNSRYTIADPTYVNAPLGLSMPTYKNLQATIIPTNSSNATTNLSRQFWQLTNSWGGYRAGNQADAQRDSYGNIYLTGYYSQEAQPGNQLWKSEAGSRQAFVAKYKADNTLEWARNIEASKLATGITLALDKNENPLIAGSFSGEIAADAIRISAEHGREDVFIASYTKNGQLFWLKKAGLDTVNYTPYLNYVVKLDDEGENLKTRLYFENGEQLTQGLYCSGRQFTFVGSINQTVGMGMKPLSFNAENDFNVIDYLKEENDALTAAEADKSIAGLFAVINLIKSSGMVIPGKEAQQALDKYNPSFKTKSPSIYQNIGNVVFMKNEEGIIQVQTNNGKSVSFDKIKINNNARLRITSLQDGNEQIDMLSGMQVGKAFIWYNLNFVRLMRHNGDMIFDYDTDHTRKTVNMKSDILD
ncbi:MAG: hypothetical protein M0Q90_01895 [Bacteroidales bacterium]|nr:hypothetical protein [Bacteroidales bacterium]